MKDPFFQYSTIPVFRGTNFALCIVKALSVAWQVKDIRRD